MVIAPVGTLFAMPNVLWKAALTRKMEKDWGSPATAVHEMDAGPAEVRARWDGDGQRRNEWNRAGKCNAGKTENTHKKRREVSERRLQERLTESRHLGLT